MELNIGMQRDIIKNLVYAMVALIASIAVSYCIGRRDGRIKAKKDDFVKMDTLVIVDTIVQYEAKIEERIKIERVLVPVTDTIRLHDTLFIYLEREQVIWQDDFSKVYASGIQPQIDSVLHFVTERVVTKELTRVVNKPCRWGLGIHAGYGLQLGSNITAAPYIGVGVSYNILSW